MLVRRHYAIVSASMLQMLCQIVKVLTGSGKNACWDMPPALTWRVDGSHSPELPMSGVRLIKSDGCDKLIQLKNIISR